MGKICFDTLFNMKVALFNEKFIQRKFFQLENVNGKNVLWYLYRHKGSALHRLYKPPLIEESTLCFITRIPIGKISIEYTFLSLWISYPRLLLLSIIEFYRNTRNVPVIVLKVFQTNHSIDNFLIIHTLNLIRMKLSVWW